MKISKLTIAGMFVASMAWTGVAKADDPCGAPAELLEACEVVEEPECYEVCEPDAMLISCMADGSAKCMAECADAYAVDCSASCAGKCEASCSDAVVPDGPQECTVSCGAECMGGCAASCLESDDKTLCFAACGQQCSAHCEVSCDGKGGGGYEPGDDGYEQPDEPGPGPGDYDAGCQASCEQACQGSCSAEGARDCEIGCQAEAVGSCKAELGKKCHEVCDEGGVLLCDEQYVDIDDVDACFAELEQYNVPVVGSRGALEPGATDIAKQGAASCSVEDEAKLGLAGALFTLLSFGLGATFLRRRRS